MKQFKVLLCVAALVMGLMLLTAVMVFADTGSIVLTGAATTFTSMSFSFQAKDLTGADFNSTDDASATNCEWDMVDARGSGAGWKISVKSSDLTGLKKNDETTPITSTLTAGTSPAYNQFGLQVQIVSGDIVPRSGSMPESGLTKNVSTAADVEATDVTVLTAPVDQGMGGYDIDPLFTIYLPAGVYAGTANLTLTVTQADSPA